MGGGEAGVGDQGYARIQGRETDGRRDDYTKLFWIPCEPS
jgi:hypothetical protein